MEARLIIGLAIICGIISGMIGKSLRQNYVIFFCLGFFLNILGLLIAIIIYFVMKEVERRRKARAQPEYLASVEHPSELFSGDLMTCWNCGEIVLEIDEFCWNCGEVIEKRQTPKFCPTCHSEMVEEDEYCMNCGSKVDIS